MRFSRVGTSNNVNSFHIPNANGSWVDGVGTTYMPGAGCDACGLFPAVSDGGVSSFGDTFVPLLGIISETTAYYNYDREGNVLPVGEPVRRRFATDEYEFYVQDSWKMGETLTFTRRACATACSRRPTRPAACRSRPTSSWATGWRFAGS